MIFIKNHEFLLMLGSKKMRKRKKAYSGKYLVEDFPFSKILCEDLTYIRFLVSLTHTCAHIGTRSDTPTQIHCLCTIQKDFNCICGGRICKDNQTKNP